VTTQEVKKSRRSRNVALTALRVGSRVLFERMARPMAYTLEDVPCSPYAITPAWLTAALCARTPSATVTRVAVEQASAGTHERHRLRVSYNEAGQRAGLPASIFTKSLPSIVTRMIAGFNGHARIEGRFYSDVRPLLEIEAPLATFPPTIGRPLRLFIFSKTSSQPNLRPFAATRQSFPALWPRT
jgi:hypothetical protein